MAFANPCLPEDDGWEMICDPTSPYPMSRHADGTVAIYIRGKWHNTLFLCADWRTWKPPEDTYVYAQKRGECG